VGIVMAAGSRRLTSLHVRTDDLEFGFDVDRQLYYIRSGPLTQRGETWLTEIQWIRLSFLLAALRREERELED
jgi:hypothetical protein